jgi:hypothetical protein
MAAGLYRADSAEPPYFLYDGATRESTRESTASSTA